MGADGGTIPKRCELVQKKKKAEKVQKSVKNAAKWQTCQMSQRPLKKPIVADRLGRLYSKEAVIEAILNKAIPKSCGHIRGIKDVKELRLTDNKDYKDDEVKGGDTYFDENQTPFLCPVTTVPMNGINPFLVNWKCGCVISEKATQEVKSDVCHACGGERSDDEVVVLYPDEALLEKYMEALEKRKAKKRKDGKEEKDDKAKKPKKEEPSTSSEDASTIQDDPTKTNAYKNLFTTCEAAKNKPKNHWVTFNPLFY